MARASKGGKKSGKKQERMNPPPDQLVYRGPTRLPVRSIVSAEQTTTMEFVIINSVATSAGGVLATVFSPGSSATSATDWSNASGMYKEYRILSSSYEFVPWNTYNWPTTTTLAPVYSVIDRGDATAIGSLSALAGYVDTLSSHKPGSGFVVTARMSGTDEAGWTLTTTTPSTANQFHTKLYSAGNTASITLYDYIGRIMVQFRNRV